jgi:hypothetical protein
MLCTKTFTLFREQYLLIHNYKSLVLIFLFLMIITPSIYYNPVKLDFVTVYSEKVFLCRNVQK